MFSMLRRPMSESLSVVAVTHSGFMPSSSMRITCVVESLPPLTGDDAVVAWRRPGDR